MAIIIYLEISGFHLRINSKVMVYIHSHSQVSRFINVTRHPIASSQDRNPTNMVLVRKSTSKALAHGGNGTEFKHIYF